MKGLRLKLGFAKLLMVAGLFASGHLHNFHATILHLLAVDHTRLTFYHNGIQRRLTNVHGYVVKDVLT